MGGSQFKASQGKKSRAHLNSQKLSGVAYLSSQQWQEASEGRITVQASPGINARLYSKNN
jgi:hypothetical protein